MELCLVVRRDYVSNTGKCPIGTFLCFMFLTSGYASRGLRWHFKEAFQLQF